METISVLKNLSISFHKLKHFSVYEGIIAAIGEYKIKTSIQLVGACGIDDIKVWTIIQKGNKAVQTTLLKSEAIRASVLKWNVKFEVPLHWKKIFLKCKQTTIDTQLRWFQLQLLHRTIPTNKYLLLGKIYDSALCPFCRHEVIASHIFSGPAR